MNKFKHIALLSGGKDSVCMLGKIFEYKMPLDEILMCSTPEFPQMYEYIDTKLVPWIESNGYTLKILGNWKETWDKWSNGAITKGKNKGIIRGFPPRLLMGWCTREFKVYPANRYLKGIEHKRYLGIAVDEPRRIKLHDELLYPLVDFNLTENDCLQWTKDNDLYNPLYDYFTRLGCWLCPKQGEKNIKKLMIHFPDLWSELKEIEQKFIDVDAMFSLWAIHGTKYYENKFKEDN